jgi:hypothetical protein
MQDNFPGPGAPEGGAERTGTIAELVLERQRVVGEIAYQGPNRRVIDLLNGGERAYMSMRNAVVDDLVTGRGEPRRYKILTVRRQAVLFAVPPWLRPARAAGEVLQKVPLPATILLPGYEISGKVYLPQGADLEVAPYMEHRPFVAMTDATIVSMSEREEVRVEPVVVANLGCAYFYAPATH